MIELTRLNGNPLYVNCDLIKWAEAAPDTLLTLINGEKIVVRESCEQLVERVNKHRLLLLAECMKLTPEPETLLRTASAASLSGSLSRAATEGQSKGRHLHARDSEDDAEAG